jgi:hypothetical protein
LDSTFKALLHLRDKFTDIAPNIATPDMSKGIDYSKWDKMKFEDTSDSDGTPHAPQADVVEASSTSETSKMSIGLEKPQQAEGSAWNVSNFHWEEQNLDKCAFFVAAAVFVSSHSPAADGATLSFAACCSTGASRARLNTAAAPFCWSTVSAQKKQRTSR